MISSYLTRCLEASMGFPTKVQLIQRKASEQWYINFPSALAQALDFTRGETVEWHIEDKSLLALRRLSTPPSLLKKLRQHPLLHPAALARLFPRLRPAPPRRTRPSALAKQFALLGSSYRHRFAHYRLSTILRLVGHLSPLLSPSPSPAADLLRHPSPRPVPTPSPVSALCCH